VRAQGGENGAILKMAVLYRLEIAHVIAALRVTRISNRDLYRLEIVRSFRNWLVYGN
jgi:hypothetical protein